MSETDLEKIIKPLTPALLTLGTEIKEAKKNSNPSATQYHYSDAVTFYVQKDIKNKYIKEVNMGCFAATTSKSRIIVSEAFGPCQAVVAKLKDGNFALYHAWTPNSYAKGFKDLVNYLKNNIDEIFVFQKHDNKNNLFKASVLAVELTIALGVNVPRIEVTRYNSIICDSRRNKVIIGVQNTLKVEDTTLTTKRCRLVVANAISLDLSKAIPYAVSRQEVIFYNEKSGSSLYTEARLCIALSEKNLELALQVKNEISREKLNLWRQESQHATNPIMLENFNKYLLRNTFKKTPSVDDKKSNITFQATYRQRHLKNWEKELLIDIQKGDYTTVKKKLIKNKDCFVEYDKLILLANKLYPEALKQLYQNIEDEIREQICLLIEQVAVKNKFSLKIPKSSIGHNHLSIAENSPTIVSKGALTPDIKSTISRDRFVVIHVPSIRQRSTHASTLAMPPQSMVTEASSSTSESPNRSHDNEDDPTAAMTPGISKLHSLQT